MIEATRVIAAVQVTSRRYRLYSALPFLTAAAFAVKLATYHVQHGFRHGVGSMMFMAVWLTLTPAAIAAWLLVKARRVAAIGTVAASDPTLTWHMSENMIGVPGRFDLTFRISAALQDELLSVPRATLRGDGVRRCDG